MKPRKIVFTGPESSGKTHSSKILSKELECNLVPEMAREYLKEKKLDYNYGDIIRIAELQMLAENEFIYEKTPIVCDTDLLTIKIWLAFTNQPIPTWITEHLLNFPAIFYLLMTPNIPWEDDGLRQNKEDRKAIFNLYQLELNKLGVPYTIIDKLDKERENQILETIKKLNLQGF